MGATRGHAATFPAPDVCSFVSAHSARLFGRASSLRAAREQLAARKLQVVWPLKNMGPSLKMRTLHAPRTRLITSKTLCNGDTVVELELGIMPDGPVTLVRFER
jgi:hypothetical protein